MVAVYWNIGEELDKIDVVQENEYRVLLDAHTDYNNLTNSLAHCCVKQLIWNWSAKNNCILTGNRSNITNSVLPHGVVLSILI